MSATSGGPGPHFHRTYDETFYVISGTVRLYDGNRWFDAGPGDMLYVPAGGIHAFTNDSGAPASMLMLLTPGANRAAYFAELTHIAGRTGADRQRMGRSLCAASQRHARRVLMGNMDDATACSCRNLPRGGSWRSQEAKTDEDELAGPTQRRRTAVSVTGRRVRQRAAM